MKIPNAKFRCANCNRFYNEKDGVWERFLRTVYKLCYPCGYRQLQRKVKRLNSEIKELRKGQ